MIPHLRKLLIRHAADHRHIQSTTCGSLIELIRDGELECFDLAMLEDIKSTVPHYHLKMDEVYLILDGEITLVLYDPDGKSKRTVVLKKNEFCVIPKRVHHKIEHGTDGNRMCVMNIPKYDSQDEHHSAVLS